MIELKAYKLDSEDFPNPSLNIDAVRQLFTQGRLKFVVFNHASNSYEVRMSLGKKQYVLARASGDRHSATYAVRFADMALWHLRSFRSRPVETSLNLPQSFAEQDLKDCPHIAHYLNQWFNALTAEGVAIENKPASEADPMTLDKRGQRLFGITTDFLTSVRQLFGSDEAVAVQTFSEKTAEYQTMLTDIRKRMRSRS